jgi:hypothetical protein
MVLDPVSTLLNILDDSTLLFREVQPQVFQARKGFFDSHCLLIIGDRRIDISIDEEAVCSI